MRIEKKEDEHYCKNVKRIESNWRGWASSMLLDIIEERGQWRVGHSSAMLPSLFAGTLYYKSRVFNGLVKPSVSPHARKFDSVMVWLNERPVTSPRERKRKKEREGEKEKEKKTRKRASRRKIENLFLSEVYYDGRALGVYSAQPFHRDMNGSNELSSSFSAPSSLSAMPRA